MPAAPSPAGRSLPGAPLLSGADLRLALLLGMGALALYAALGLRLAAGRYSEYYNLAFDFDPPRYVALLGADEYERGNVKHPLTLLLRPLAWPLLAAGFAAKEAAALVMAGFGAASVAVTFLFLRSLAVAAGIAAALAALFAVSGSQVFTAIIPEAYGPAAFGLAATWLLAVWRLHDLRHGGWARFAVAAYSYGITTTNLLQPVFAEALAWWRHRGLAGAIGPMIRYGAVLAVLCLALTALVWIDVLRDVLADPVAVAKEVYWQRTKGLRVDALDTVLRLLGYAVVSPDFTEVRLENDGITMLDFRAPRFGPVAELALIAWHLFWLAGAAAMVWHGRTRWLALGMAAMLAANVVFHLDFQFRGSVYLYAAHTHFLVFALGAGMAPLLRPGTAMARLYLAGVLLLVALVGSVTLERARVLVGGFDVVRADCLAPCTETPR